MNRTEFLKQLESLLKGISPAEREAALEYYSGYFDDAGAENEQAVIEALGTPAKVAEMIKKELFANEYGQNAGRKAQPGDKAVIKYGSVEESQDTCQDSSAQEYGAIAKKPGKEKKLGSGTIALIVILCIFASPFLLSIAAGVGSLLFGIVAAWASLIVGFGVTAIVLFVVMLALLILGILGILISPLGALGVIGGALLTGGIGLLFLLLTVWMAGVITPAVVRGIAALCRKLFGRREKFA